MKKSVIILFIFFCSCKSKKVYTAQQLENIRITDSIAQSQKDILIQDFRDENEFIERH